MSFRDCLVKLITFSTKSGLNLSQENLKGFADQLDKIGASAMSRAEFNDAAMKLFDSQIDRLNSARAAERALNSSIIEPIPGKVIRGELGGGFDKKGKPNYVENFKNAIAGGSLRPGEGSRLDPYRMAATRTASLQQIWNQGIKPYADIVNKRLLIDEIFQEREALEKNGPIGQSGSKDALEIAKVMKAVNNETFDLKKAYNPYLNQAKDFIVNHVHVREKVSAVDKPAWIADALQAYGKKSYPEATPQEKVAIFSSIYDRIKEGTFGKVIDTEDAGKFVMGDKSRTNILTRMAQERSLIPSDWKSEADYFKKYGPDTIADLMGKVTRRAGQDIALIQKFGSKPRENYEAMFAKTAVRLDGKAREKFIAAKPTFDEIFRQASGGADQAAINTTGQVTRGLLNISRSARTAASYFRMIQDLGQSFGIARSLDGKNLFQHTFDIVGGYLHAITNHEFKTQMMENMYIMARSSQASLMGGVETGASDGFMGTTATKISEWSGHQMHDHAGKVSLSMVITKGLAEMSDKEFGQLSDQYKLGMKSYGINEPEWNLYRKSLENPQKDGVFNKSYMTPDGVNWSKDADVIQYMKEKGLDVSNPSKEAIFLARKQATYALADLINDHADMGLANPGTRQKAFMYRGTDINNGLGSFLRIAQQFHGAMWTTLDSYRRLMYSGGGSRSDYAGVAQMAAATMFWWAVGDYMHQAINGKTLQDPKDPDLWGRALLASGVGGMYGDALSGSFRHNDVMSSGMGAVLGIGGPLVSDAGQAVGITTNYLQKAYGRYQGTSYARLPNRELFDLVMNNVPGLNIWGAKGALDYYIFNGLREFMDTGYLARLEQRVGRRGGMFDDHQSYFAFKPTDSVRLLGN